MMHHLSTDICHYLYSLADEQNGENVSLELNGVPTLIIQNREDAEYVLRRNYDNYEKNMTWFKQALGSSRFFENGQVWKRHKNLTQPFLNCFDDHQTVELSIRHAQWGVAQFIEASSAGQATLDDSVFRKMAMAVFIENFFPISLEESGINIENIAELMEFSSEFSFIPAGSLNIQHRRRLVKLRALRRQVNADLKIFRDPERRNALLERILSVESEPDSQVVLEEELMAFLAAGSESTAATMSWVCYLLASHPEQQEMLYQEVINHPHPICGEDLSQMPRLMTFISEALRLYPPIPIIIRQSLGNDKIGNDIISERQNIIISFIGIMRNQNVYQNPGELNLRDDTYSPLNDKESGIGISFSHGQRVCGGKQFALVELAGFVHTFLKQASFALTSDLPPRFYWKSQMVNQGGQPVSVTPRSV
ncbi:cytochrome P450 [Limnobaculum parvum]|uniref:Cytochrome P450 n=1 Tax=Limnobaculum parvum TaxID=2172103 RepID=A0A2Y9TX46_9GAMM|nr:cytochrome P450 [Limnobaculum parvum]AWH88255.1 cytochrome P450 [Limnobaculum parvum]